MFSQSEHSDSQPLRRSEVEQLLRAPNLLRSDHVQRRRFPTVIPTPLHALPLTVRVQNCLTRLHITDLGSLDQFSIGDLLRVRNLGRESLINLLSSVVLLISERPGPPTGDVERRSVSSLVTSAAEHLRAQPYSSRVCCNDPRFRLEANKLLAISNASSDEPPLGASASLRTVAHRLVGRRRDSSPPEVVLNLIRKIRLGLARAGRLSLEQELHDIAQRLTSERNVGIVTAFFGWSGGGKKTLQAVGDDFHLTRERVRQVTSSFSKKVHGASPFTPTLRRALNSITRQLPASEESVRAELLQHGLTRTSFAIDGVLSSAELFGLPVSFVVENDVGLRTVIQRHESGLARTIVRVARKVVSHFGVGKVAELCDELNESKGVKVGGSIVRQVLGTIRSLHWLEKDAEWFYLDDVSRNHLATVVIKVLSVAPRIHVSEMRSALSADPRGLGFAPPSSVVLEFCRVACDCEIEDQTIIAKHPPSPSTVLSSSEQLAYLVLSKGGPLLHRTEFERRCVESGMNRCTFSVKLSNSPMLARYGAGVYGLRGSTIRPGDVERCIPSPIKRRSDHGWTDTAKPWVAVELSPAAISSGVIGIPSAIRNFIVGRFLIRTDDRVEVGTLVVAQHGAAWGLASLFRRRGGEPGDVVVLTFDLQRHEVVVRFHAKEDVFSESFECIAAPDYQ